MLTSYIFNLKYSIFFFFIFCYLFILIIFILYIFIIDSLVSKYISDLKKNSTSTLEFTLIAIFLTFAGLPPFFFFFVKYFLISFILNNGFFINSLLVLSLLFLSWFIYFSVIRNIILAKDYNNFFSYKNNQIKSTWLVIIFFILSMFLIIGFFFLYDFFLIIFNLFVFIC